MAITQESVPTYTAPTTAPKGFIGRYAGGNLGIWAGLMAPALVGMYLKISGITSGTETEAVYGMVVAVGSTIALFCNPLWGRLSDRTRSRWGRRNPWILMGTIVGSLGLVIIVFSDQILPVLIGWMLAQAGFNAALAALTATIPDEVPEKDRGKFSGVYGATFTIGIMLGSIIGAVTANLYIIFLVPAAFSLAMIIMFVSWYKERVVDRPQEKFTFVDFLMTFVFNPLKHPDFGWAWISKFLVMGGQVVVMLTLTFYIQNTMGFTPEKTASVVAVLWMVNYALSATTAFFGGQISDKMGKRKPLVIASALGTALGMGILATTPSMSMVWVAMLIMGLTSGLFLAVDTALVTQVLPNPNEPAKDLGVANIANALPQPIVGALFPMVLAIGAGNNWELLYTIGAAVTIVGALTVILIRKVK